MVAIALAVSAGIYPEPAGAAAWSQNVNTGYESGIDIKAFSMIDVIPSRGFYPVRIAIENRSAKDGQWRVSFTKSYNLQEITSFDLRVPRGSKQTFEAMIPFPDVENRVIHMDIDGPGIESRKNHLHSLNPRVADFYLAIESDFAIRNKGPIEAEISSNRYFTTSANLTLPELSDDLRAYSGIDIILMRRADWERLEGAHRQTLKQWIIQGGQLVLASATTDTGSPPVGLPKSSANGQGKWRIGWGEVKLIKELDGLIEPSELLASIIRCDQHDNTDSWLLWDYDVGDIVLPAGLLSVMVIVIAVVICPLNLWLAARSRSPARVIWTTPVLALGASLLLVIFILFKDGIGGSGKRFLLAFLDAESRTIAMIQEQVSRTGVLLRRDFQLPRNAVIHQIDIHYGSDWSQFFDRREQGHLKYAPDGTCEGDWFRSRAIQGHIIQQTEASRSELALRSNSGGAPTVFSSIDLDLSQLYLIDDHGNAWKTNDLQAGEDLPLASSSLKELQEWWGNSGGMAGGHIRNALQKTPIAPGHFYAEVKPDARRFIPTLESIRWADDKILIYGTFTAGEIP